MLIRDVPDCQRPMTLSELFLSGIDDRKISHFAIRSMERKVYVRPEGDTIIVDTAASLGGSCLFFRGAAGDSRTVGLSDGSVGSLDLCPAGGWLLRSTDCSGQAYWFPRPPMLRKLDQHGRILIEEAPQITKLSAAPGSIHIEVKVPEGWCLDFVVWHFSEDSRIDSAELMRLVPLETQAIFLWGSHTPYGKPGDVYRHLIHGHVYEDRYAWPHRRKICSENDAHALYVTLTGLQRATGKALYELLARQLVLSVISRQCADGGWVHGEWTDSMESHFRLCGSAIHLLMDALDENPDPAVRTALDKAVAWISSQRDELECGPWFLHDSLELSESGMHSGPFRWLKSRALGKSVSNMLVLNTHLDTTIALDRYRSVTGTTTYGDLVVSAANAARTVLGLRSAEWLYRLLFRAINLTLLSSSVATKLPLPARAIKRIAWKYLIPNLHRVKTQFPRIVMPGGYVDRAIPLQSWAFHYLTINIMDMLRFRRRFSANELAEVINAALRFAKDSGVLDRWQELQYERYALGFWAEALYHACTLSDDMTLRHWLADAVLRLEALRMGLPPSTLGTNREAVSFVSQAACPQPRDSHIRVVNLTRSGAREYLFVNSADRDVRFDVEMPDLNGEDVTWVNGSGDRMPCSPPAMPSRSWLQLSARAR